MRSNTLARDMTIGAVFRNLRGCTKGHEEKSGCLVIYLFIYLNQAARPIKHIKQQMNTLKTRQNDKTEYYINIRKLDTSQLIRETDRQTDR